MSCSSRGDINAEVRNNPAEYRYEVWVDDELAGYTQYVLRPGRIAFLHTEVYQPYKGMGGRLARAALDDARQGAGGNAVLPVHRSLHRAPPR
jgi:predicted GNAT family acetyltransferase